MSHRNVILGPLIGVSLPFVSCGVLHLLYPGHPTNMKGIYTHRFRVTVPDRQDVSVSGDRDVRDLTVTPKLRRTV